MAQEVTTSRRARRGPTKGQRREQAILDVAEELLETVGFEQLTVEQIATAAGITRGALYFYFGSKQEVVTALVNRTLEKLQLNAAEIAVDVHTPPGEVIVVAAERTAGYWRDHGPVLRLAVEHSAALPEVQELWQKTIELYVGVLAEVLVRAGVPDEAGPRGATAQARTWCWAAERNFYLAAIDAAGFDGLDDAALRILALWERLVTTPR